MADEPREPHVVTFATAGGAVCLTVVHPAVPRWAFWRRKAVPILLSPVAALTIAESLRKHATTVRADRLRRPRAPSAS